MCCLIFPTEWFFKDKVVNNKDIGDNVFIIDKFYLLTLAVI